MKFGKGEGASGVINEEAKVVGKVYITQIPSSKPIISKAQPVSSTVVTTRPITKGIVIGSSGEGGSQSKPKETLVIQDRGNKILI